MKMTLNIDESLLGRVVAATGAGSKTKAVDLALREIDRRAELTRIASEGLGLTPEHLKEVFDPASDVGELQRRERPISYARKSRPRR